MIKFQSNKTTSIIGIFIAVLLVLLYRRYDTFSNPQLWAEDGVVFLQQYHDTGLKSIITPYAGYLHLIPRLVTALFGLLSLNLLYLPAFFNASCFIIIFLLALRFWSSAGQMGLQHRVAYAVMFLLVPVGTEMFMNITNIIWFTSLFLVDFLIIGYKHYEQSRYKVLTCLLIFIISLTGPFSLLLSPLVVFVIFLERKTIRFQQLVPLVIILLCGCIQVLCIKFTANGVSRVAPGGVAEPLHLVKLIKYNISDLIFLRSGMLPDMPERLKTIISLLVFMVIGFFIYRNYTKINLERKYLLILAPVVFLGSFIVAFWPMETIALAFGCPRYYFVPYTCIAWLFLIGLDKQLQIKDVILYLCFFLLHSRSMRSSLPDKEWKKQVVEYQNGVRTEININPEGWKVNLQNKK